MTLAVLYVSAVVRPTGLKNISKLINKSVVGDKQYEGQWDVPGIFLSMNSLSKSISKSGSQNTPKYRSLQLLWVYSILYRVLQDL